EGALAAGGLACWWALRCVLPVSVCSRSMRLHVPDRRERYRCAQVRPVPGWAPAAWHSGAGDIPMTWSAVALMTMAGSLVAAPMMTGCQNLPGTPRSQLAVAGGVLGGIVGGAAAGTWWAGALIGAGVGLAAGYVIG